ncbi:Pleckstrin y domain-containing A member 1, partial [Coemansia sp. RSA 2598]
AGSGGAHGGAHDCAAAAATHGLHRTLTTPRSTPRPQQQQQQQGALAVQFASEGGDASTALPPGIDPGHEPAPLADEDCAEDEEPNFNVDQRREIETRLFEDRVVLRGYLLKQDMLRQWRRRWFVLRQNTLSYYQDDREYEVRQIIRRPDIHDIRWPDPSSAKARSLNRTYFKVVTDKRNYWLAHDDSAKAREWFTTLVRWSSGVAVSPVAIRQSVSVQQPSSSTTGPSLMVGLPRHADDHAQTAGTGRPRRFRKRVPSQELLQEDYEQNMMGATAGFFCAIWAGHLLGEHLSVALTTWSPADDQGIHRLAASDLGVVVLLATKVLFLRALVFRYILRPALKHLLGTVEFAQRQAVAETVGCVLWALLLVGPAMWILWVSSGGDGLGAMEKLFVVAQCAARVAGVAVGFLESRPLDRVLAQYLLAGSLFSAGMLGQIRTAALLVCTWELPGLFGRIGGGSLRHIS